MKLLLFAFSLSSINTLASTETTIVCVDPLSAHSPTIEAYIKEEDLGKELGTVFEASVYESREILDLYTGYTSTRRERLSLATDFNSTDFSHSKIQSRRKHALQIGSVGRIALTPNVLIIDAVKRNGAEVLFEIAHDQVLLNGTLLLNNAQCTFN